MLIGVGNSVFNSWRNLGGKDTPDSPENDKKKIHCRYLNSVNLIHILPIQQFLQLYEPKTEKLDEEKTVNKAMMAIVLSVAVSLVTAVVLWQIEQKDFLDSLLESISALTTTDITTGIT